MLRPLGLADSECPRSDWLKRDGKMRYIVLFGVEGQHGSVENS